MKKVIQLFALITLDIAAYYVSLYGAWYGREKVIPLFYTPPTPNYTFEYYTELLWIPVIFIFFIAYKNIYTGRIPLWDESKKLAHANTLSFMMLVAVVTLGQAQGLVSRAVISLLWLISIFIFPIFHLYGKKLLFMMGITKEKVLVLGAGKTGRLISQWLERERHIGYEVLGYLDDEADRIGTYIDGKKVFGQVRHYTRFIKELQINTIIIAMPSLGPDKISSLAFEVQQKVKNTMIVPNLYGIALLNTELLHLFYEEIFLLKVKNNLKSTYNRIIKRLFDLIVSIVLLPFLLLLMAVIGIITKLTSPGPVIYTQQRIGIGGRPFNCYKFRTMVQDSERILNELLQSNRDMKDEWDRHWKLSNDPRITPIGMFLRKTSLDELPQIINVLMGDMSLVGPRPYLQREMYAIADDIEDITKVPPGITGLWQVSGRSSTTYEHRIRLDIWYMMNWSLGLDLYILLRTIKVVLFMKGVR
ncbi:undecaprenyl-phosphate galactose phosphotransferase WbaP [Candidatus Magnetominusculus xianensis]|uniref:UDP-phosphate galactose phosphotransferase n=1 Tax=Candidatus Magnetominusculus xianensis TaxID=1748249 RepID=A0ABR5SG17_9BACT|nr:undecaprenyl-phosphate galactose phosphotransferase WbaP [Candidatus Magnetominusculus xianensis]KWT78202.1 UDP-phosphate galactose phosphotransferase [Candidatus Magnetominusculus xianensis]MBF0402846.1 undecaprenyl-phosphate galactose phosphotransferase WbaP [Nitrospirota bacterium]